ncbi:alpha/beta fold hydrolase [Streptomyces sp. PT12]|uniref:alpha/beta fold hydrolase n=1 Tax=Streptomyces sp. PT12 TaxID=1510197 RepID=UPI000DE418FF|nr:alpha/beta fold hydrolase [Streptomyces sp. PT12]RBM11992.1 alpha/beta hydrolase [Streptomyces sp. PT12]
MSRPPFCEPPAEVRAHRLATRRGEFAVLDAVPADREPVATALLVPGYTGSKEDFIALLVPLADAGIRAVAVDGRGQYESVCTDGPAAFGLGALAEDVLAQAEALGEGPLHLVGHSLGGLISRGAVLRAVAAGSAPPFASLTLIGSGPGRIVRRQRWRARALGAGLPLLGARRIWRLTQRGVEPGEVGAFLRRRWLANAPTQLRTTGRALCYEPDRVDLLARVGLPIHVLSGERDGIWPIPAIDRMAERLGAHRTVITGAEHSPNAQAPAATASALLAFWAALPSPRPPASPDPAERDRSAAG